MNKTQIMATQKRIGAAADGFWGPKSIAACQRHLRALLPSQHPFPTEAQVRAGTSIFGRQGIKDGYTPPMKGFTPPYPVFLYGNTTTRLTKITAHELVAASLEEILVMVRETLGLAGIREAGMDRYYGCYNPRNTRGGSVASMHSWAIAVDFDAGRNGNSTHWPTRAVMPVEVMECFARKGWLAAGAFWSRDAMHFQATR
jgi:hypothetical protein